MELAQLSQLQRLYLDSNQLTGEIPVELAQLSQLQRLDLGNNQLTGEIPVELAQLSQLQRLDLGNNQLTGEIPVELAQLSQLQRLDLGNNQLTGEIPVELAQLSQLQGVGGPRCSGLDSNQLTGEIPVELAQLSQLLWLYLDSNQLTGEIPVELAQLSQLQRLDLGRNQLTGEIPVELSQLSQLQGWTSAVDGGDPGGAVPTLPAGRVVPRQNQLTGEIPVELSQLSQLGELSLDRNQLTGEIPVELSQLSQLRWLDLSRNQLTGEIPVELSQLSQLNRLYLHSNELNGPIPSWLVNLTALRELSLWSNQLTGTIPPEVAPAQDRAALVVLYTATGGPNWTDNTNWTYSREPLSEWHGVSTDEQGRVEELRLSANGLNGTIGAELGVLTRLTGLYLNGNTLSGPLPLTLAQLSQLSVLNIQSTTLCAPTDATFQAWLATINFQGSVCDATVTGGPTYYFPHLAVGASWQTTITYINYSPEEVTCQTDFISDHGSPLMVSFAGLGTVVSRTDVLPPGGSVHQETDVELSAPLAPGWALANCTGPVQASLLFRQHSSEGMPVAEAGVNAATVPATRFVTFAEQGEGKNGTGVAYANPSDTAALVTFTARDADGEVRATKDLMLPPNGHGAQNMPTLFDLSSFTGSLEVSSTEPIVSLSLNFEAASGFSSLPPGELDAAAQGSTTYYFPHLAVGASWQTTITYINYSREEVTCQTDFISDHGSPLMVSFAELGTVDSRTDVLPPGGSVHQETNVELSAPLAPGWALANCTGPVQASLLFRWYNSEGMPVAEAGVNAATVPATRFVTFAEQGEGKNGTGVAYANPSDTAALVTFTARDADGEVLASEDLMLPPNWHGAQNMPTLFDLSSFTGSLEVTSTEPIVSLSLNFEAAPVFSSLPPGELDLPVAPPGGINWCTDLQTVWVSFRLKNDKTVSVCRDPSDKLVYSFGTLGREPELEYEGPIVATFSLPAMLWGESIGDLSTLADAVAAGEVGGSDELAREMVTAIESGETNGFYVLNMLTGLISESVYLFRTGGWEYAVVSSVGRPMGGCDGVDRRIDLLSPDQIRYHLREVGSDLDCGVG